MNVGQLIRQLEKYDRRSEVEVKLIIGTPEGTDLYVSGIGRVVPTKNHRNQTIVQVTNEG